MKRTICIISLTLATLAVNAQTSFTDILRKDLSGKGKVTVVQSKDIDNLINGKTPEKPSITPESPNTTVSNVATSNATTKPEISKTPVTGQSSLSSSNSSHPSEATDTEVDLRKKVMRNSYKITGYRIQFFSGGNQRIDRQKAEQAGVTIKKMFPNEPVYVHFYSPSWKGRMGNYRDYAEAQRILKQVKAVFPQSCIVKGKINIQY